MAIVKKEMDWLNFSPPAVIEEIKKKAESHNAIFTEVIVLLNKVGMGYWDFKIEGLEDYLLSPEYKVDKEWVKKQLAILEAEARSAQI